MSKLVACKECGAVFVRADAPSRQCPTCHHNGVEGGGIVGTATKHAWHEGIDS